MTGGGGGGFKCSVCCVEMPLSERGGSGISDGGMWW